MNLNDEMEDYEFETNPNDLTTILEDLTNLTKDDLIDPYNPDNFDFLSKTNNFKQQFEIKSNVQHIKSSNFNDRNESDNDLNDKFRLNEDLNYFCPIKKFINNKRIELLCARFNNDIKLKDYRLVPHNEIEIEIPTDLNIFEDLLWVDPIDVQRYQGKVYLKHVYNIITNHCTVISKNLNHQDLLIGDTAPTLNGAIEALKNMFIPRRPLHPSRSNLSANNSRRIHLNDSNGKTNFHIIVNIVRANGIPHRNQIQQIQYQNNQLIPNCKLIIIVIVIY